MDCGAWARYAGRGRLAGLRRTLWGLAPPPLALAVFLMGGAFAPTITLATGSERSVLIVAPHPDDDLLFASGVAANALLQCATVKIVYMKNWDRGGTAVGCDNYLLNRLNANDQITALPVRFSDGSSLTTAALANDGRALTLDFPARTITSLELSVDAASAQTRGIGLVEIEVYGQAPSGMGRS